MTNLHKAFTKPIIMLVLIFLKNRKQQTLKNGKHLDHPTGQIDEDWAAFK